ncbi:hypothetical protein HOLleu_03921 [Holothuria leucospilota]|uniref:Uncharacterized protein n=1 Tax=Holothuria leucospilota TaxID=206669 RepID=A0A9Q1HKI1_HOLLE|nr:hypothetical protein HOLleu_03921 [Holothuria leucospilota]
MDAPYKSESAEELKNDTHNTMHTQNDTPSHAFHYKPISHQASIYRYHEEAETPLPALVSPYLQHKKASKSARRRRAKHRKKRKRRPAKQAESIKRMSQSSKLLRLVNHLGLRTSEETLNRFIDTLHILETDHEKQKEEKAFTVVSIDNIDALTSYAMVRSDNSERVDFLESSEDEDHLLYDIDSNGSDCDDTASGPHSHTAGLTLDSGDSSGEEF